MTPIPTSLCWTYALQQQAEQALPYCERAVKIDPQSVYRNTRGLAYALLGRYDAAIEDFQAYIEWLEQQPGAGSQAVLARAKSGSMRCKPAKIPLRPRCWPSCARKTRLTQAARSSHHDTRSGPAGDPIEPFLRQRVRGSRGHDRVRGGAEAGQAGAVPGAAG